MIGFGLATAVGVTLLFGTLPALRASRIKPVNALKGGEEPHAKRRLMYGLIAAQVAFCFVVLFVAGLFGTTFAKLAKVSTGFSSERVLLLDTVTQHDQPAVKWDQMAAALRSVPGVQTTAIEDWPMLSGTMHNDRISINGSGPSQVLTFFLAVSPGWLEAMRIPMLSGRDFRDSDSSPSVAIVNETFAKTYFNGANPVGSSFVTKRPDGVDVHYEIVGLVHDAIYRELREVMLPQAYIPIHRAVVTSNVSTTSLQTATPTPPLAAALRPMGNATIVVRTSNDDPTSLCRDAEASYGTSRS